jgi:CHAT domain-containing protein
VVILAALFVSSAAFAESVDVGARVVKVAGNRATIDKGTKAGVKLGTAGEMYPMRTSEGSTSSSVDFNVRLALGKVVEVKDDTSVVTLDAIADAVTTDSYFSYKVTVGNDLAQSALFRVTALGVELRPQWKDVPYITLEAMLADPSAKLRDATLDAMIKDVKDMKSTVEEHLKGRIEEGQHHGKTAGQVVDALDRAQLLDFLVFVEGFPGKYIGHHWNLPEVYFTWVINGTPSGEKERQLRALRTTIDVAKAATAAGKLDAARVEWAKVLKVAPDHKDASDAVARIERIQIVMRRVASDPDDTAGAYQVMDELYNLGAYDLAMKQYAGLEAKSFEPFKLERLRGYVLVRQRKWSDAEVVFKKLVKDKPDDKNLPTWVTYIRAEAKLARSPTDPTALTELALVNADSKAWDSALSAYRKVLASPRATARQREAAKLAQERISLQKEVDQRLVWARGHIEDHDIKNARERIAQAVKLTDKLGDAKRAGEVLDELAQLARSSGEEELALELLNQRVTAVPDSQAARAELAYALLGFDRIDEAEKAARKAVELKGDPAYSYLILSYCARARDDMGEAEKMAIKASSNSPKYPWPMLVLARAEAARGNWEPAVAIAKKALDLDDASDMRSTHAAASRGLQASEALTADPKSERERLRLVRALAELGLSRRVGEEIGKFPATSAMRGDAWWALVESPDSRVLLKDRLQAARNAKPATAARKRQLAALEARAKLRATPTDEATRIALAKLYVQMDDFDTALATLVPLMAAPMKPVVGDLVRDAREAIHMRAQFDLARAAHGRRDFEGAIRMSLAAQQLHDRIGTLYGRLGAREIRADALVELGKYPEATKATEEARAIAAADGAVSSVAILDQRLGRLRANVGTNEALLAALQAALVLGEQLDDELSLYYVHIQLAELDSDEGRSSSALTHARTAWRMAERIGRADLARNARFQLADANLTSNRYGDAEQLATALLSDCRKHEDVANEQLSLMVLGFVAMMRGQGTIARGRFQEVYDLGTRTGQTGYRALARRFEGSAWLQSDHDAAKAAIALEQADELYASLGEGWASSTRGGVLRDLADARLQSNKLPGAQQAAEQALAMAQRFQRRPALASSRWMLALIAIKEKKADKALEHAQAAVDDAQKTDDDALLWNAWHAMAQARELKHQDKEAVEAYEKALEHLGKALVAAGGETERQGYMSTGRVRDVYKDAVALLLKVGKTARAMEILELSRDAQLKQMFDPAKVQTKDPKLRATLDKYEKTRARVQGLQKQLDEAMDKSTAQRSDAQVKALGEQIAKTRQELNQVVLDLKVSHRHLFQALAMDPQNLVGRRNDLPAGSVLVEYFVAEDALYAFVIAANLSQPAVVRVKVTSAQLEESITDFLEAVIAEGEKIKHDPKDADRVAALGRKLDDWLLEPLRPHLKDVTTLIILPFGQLYFLPFDALVVSEPGQPVRYAVEDLRISIQTATTLEHLLRPARPRSTGTMLAVSNPDGTLPGAQREVARIVKSAVPDAQVLDKKTATVKKFQDMAGAYRYLHLATHGILDADPRKSYLKLSDGPLTVEAISQLQGLEQTNELVVLSACDTANEQGHSTGDELISLAVAFAMAGSPSLVASLWEVSDDSTAELMATFYRALEQKSGDRLEALRAAKLNLLRTERGKDRPFAPAWHWASFQMYGDFRAPK